MKESLRNRQNWIQFLKFGLVGGSGVLVNMLAAIVMHKLNGGTAQAGRILFPIPGTAFNFRYRGLVWVVGFLVANLTNFQLNRTWTFQSSKHTRWWKEFWPFLAVGSVAAIVGFFLQIAFTHPGSPAYLPEPYFHEARGLNSREYWAQLFAILITVPINFLVNKFWTFAAVRDKNRIQPAEVPMVAPVVAPELVDADGEVRDDSAPGVLQEEHNVYDTADAPEQKD